MKLWIVFLVIYLLIIAVVIIFLWKFTTRGYSRRILSDITRCPFGKEKYFIVKVLNEDPAAEGIISYSLYGNYTKYAPSLYRQLDVIPNYLPEWQPRVYVPIDVPKEITIELLKRGACVIKLNGGDSEESAKHGARETEGLQSRGLLKDRPGRVGIKGHEAALWRFLPAMQTKPFITLDADDSFDTGLPNKIKRWLASGKQFFGFKPAELFLPMAAGRWGGRAGYDGSPPIPDMLERINEYCDHWFGFDEAFLKKEIWPIVKKRGIHRAIFWPINFMLIFAISVLAIIALCILIGVYRQNCELVIYRAKRATG